MVKIYKGKIENGKVKIGYLPKKPVNPRGYINNDYFMTPLVIMSIEEGLFERFDLTETEIIW